MRISFVDRNKKLWVKLDSKRWIETPHGNGDISLATRGSNGICFQQTREIYISDDMSIPSTIRVTIHEMLHCFRWQWLDKLLDKNPHPVEVCNTPIDQRLKALLPKVYWCESFAITASFIITYIIQRMI